MSNEYNRPFYEIICGLNHYKLGTIIESETGQRYKLTKTDNEYRKFSRIDKGLRFLTYENMNKKFRIVEEIDIQSLQENDSFNARADINQENINLLIKAVKQLDRQLHKTEKEQ